MPGEHDNNFFPNNTSFNIINIMNFIKYYLSFHFNNNKEINNCQENNSKGSKAYNSKGTQIDRREKNPPHILFTQCSATMFQQFRLTHSMSRMMSAPRQSIDLNISVVMIRQEASGLKLTSPVRRPTSNFPQKSLYFWLLMVLMGAVYTALVQCCKTSASQVLQQESRAQISIRCFTNISPHDRQEAVLVIRIKG